MFSGSPIPEGKGKFFDFLKAAEKADAEAKGAQTPVEQASEEQDPLADLNIEFEKQGGISSEVNLDISQEPEDKSLEEKLIFDSIQKYEVDFFK
jgi:hypothetical protein